MTTSRRSALRVLGIGMVGSVAAGVLAACGAGATATSAPTMSVSTGGTAAPTPAASASSAALLATSATTTTSAAASAVGAANSATLIPAGGKVQFWHWGPVYVPGFDQWIKDYNATNPKFQVIRNYTPGLTSDYWNKITATQAGGAAPDIFLMNNVTFIEFAHGNRVADLSSYLNQNAAATTDLSAMLQSAADIYRYSGKMMGLPWDYSAGVVVYNLDHLKALGLTPPAQLGSQWNWQTFQDYATKLTQRNGADVTRAGGWISNGTENGWYTFVVANGGSYFSADGNTCTIGSPQATQALEYLQGMLKEGVIASPAFQDQVNKAAPQAGANFINGYTSMTLVGDWFFVHYENLGDKGVNWDAALAPYAPSGKTANTANIRGTVMDPASKYKDGAFSFMAYLMTKGVQDGISKAFGEAAARNDSRDATYLDAAIAGPPPSRSTFKPALDATVPLPSSPRISSADWGAILSPVMADVYALKVAPADALKQIQTQTQAKMGATTA